MERLLVAPAYSKTTSWSKDLSVAHILMEDVMFNLTILNFPFRSFNPNVTAETFVVGVDNPALQFRAFVEVFKWIGRRKVGGGDCLVGVREGDDPNAVIDEMVMFLTKEGVGGGGGIDVRKGLKKGVGKEVVGVLEGLTKRALEGWRRGGILRADEGGGGGGGGEGGGKGGGGWI